MSKLLSHLPALCNAVRRIATEAGEITMTHFSEGMAVAAMSKADGSPVTEADRAAERHIIASLEDIVPGVPVIGEESIAAGIVPDLSGHEYFWLVDPLDGTREYAEGGKDFTVNIALIQNGVPVLGVIYAPAHGELYAGHGEGTAIRYLEDTDKEKSIRVAKPSAGGLIVMASNKRFYAETDAFLTDYKVRRLDRRSSSLKICFIAAGKADLYPGLGPTCEWDTAAGQAILTAAGGEIVTMDGAALTYGHADKKFANPPFIARSSYVAV